MFSVVAASSSLQRLLYHVFMKVTQKEPISRVCWNETSDVCCFGPDSTLSHVHLNWRSTPQGTLWPIAILDMIYFLFTSFQIDRWCLLCNIHILCLASSVGIQVAETWCHHLLHKRLGRILGDYELKFDLRVLGHNNSQVFCGFIPQYPCCTWLKTI